MAGSAQVTINLDELRAVITDIVAKVIADAVTDIRKSDAVIVDHLDNLSNVVMRVKNAQDATNQSLAKTTGRTVVYMRDNVEPVDMFGN